MNRWLELSIEYANKKCYLDDLFKVYPTIPDSTRELDLNVWESVESAINLKNDAKLIESLLRLNLFPIKDSYVAFFKRDKSSLLRNPSTINRICARIYDMGVEKVRESCSLAKETNRQMGQAFRRWLRSGALGITPVGVDEFLKSSDNAVLDAGDAQMKKFAQEFLGYEGDKGLDFVGRFNGKYVIGEAKFLTDFGGHQNAQFQDAITTLHTPNLKAIPIAILDGVVYIPGSNKLYRGITTKYSEDNIMSSLVLRDFLYQI